MPAQKRLNFCSNNRGMALYLVLAVLFVTVLLANMFLGLVLNQHSLTYHKTSRIQAYYAAKAGMVYALDRLGHADSNWTSAAAFTKYICRQSGSCGASINCNLNGNITDSTLPSNVKCIAMNIGANSANSRNVNTTVTYASSISP